MKKYKSLKESGSQKISVGGASLIMIFSILCLTIFAVLSMTTALAEKAAAERYADTTSEYYAADAKAREWADVLSKAAAADISDDAVLKEAENLGIDLKSEIKNGRTEYSYKVAMNDEGSIISVILARDESGDLKIVSFTQEEASEWVADDKIELLL